MGFLRSQKVRQKEKVGGSREVRVERMEADVSVVGPGVRVLSPARSLLFLRQRGAVVAQVCVKWNRAALSSFFLRLASQVLWGEWGVEGEGV